MKLLSCDFLFLVGLIIPCYSQVPCFTAFDQAAKQGERLTVAFFGASLTWGACANDQARTSYRQELLKNYKKNILKHVLLLLMVLLVVHGQTSAPSVYNAIVSNTNPTLSF